MAPDRVWHLVSGILAETFVSAQQIAFHSFTSGSGIETVPAGATFVTIKLQAAGASGACRTASGNASGGGGGGYAVKTVSTSPGATFSWSLGAFGAGTSFANVDGSDAADSSVTGTGVSLACAGGKKGHQTASGTAAGGLGGAASGGDVNTAGGNAPDATAGATDGGTAGIGNSGGDANTVETVETGSGSGGMVAAAGSNDGGDPFVSFLYT